MDFLQIVMITLHIIHITNSSRRKYEVSSSDETIENLLYFKDCQRKPRTHVTTSVPEPLGVPVILSPPPPPPPPPPQPDCRFPKMCCALSCGNDCGTPKDSPFISSQSDLISNIPRQSIQPIQPLMQPSMLPIQQQVRKRKKVKFPQTKMQPPINARRDFKGFTKEKIKKLIKQDDDIRKILKDLVTVTMQKVDLMEKTPIALPRSFIDAIAAKNADNPVSERNYYDYE